MSPKSILQFLAVCGIAQVAEAFATLSKPAAFKGKVAIKTEAENVVSTSSGSQGTTVGCPCAGLQNCTFGGVAGVPTVADLDWLDPDGFPTQEFVGWINYCYETCYMDPAINGSQAPFYPVCGNARASRAWRAEACTSTWQLRRTQGSIFYDDESDFAAAVCPGAQVSLDTDAICTLITAEKSIHLPVGVGCQQGMNYLATDDMGRHDMNSTCENLWGYRSLTGTAPQAFTCTFSVTNQGTKKCKDHKSNFGPWDPRGPRVQPNFAEEGCKFCPIRWESGSAFNCEESRRVPYFSFVTGGDIADAVSSTTDFGS